MAQRKSKTADESIVDESLKDAAERVQKGNANEDFNPLVEPVKSREYTKPLVNPNEINTDPIPEPNIIPPTLKQLEQQFESEYAQTYSGEFSSGQTGASGQPNMGAAEERFTPPNSSQFQAGQSGGQSRPRESANPAMDDMTPKEKKKGAKVLVKVGLEAYGFLWKMASNTGKISEKKLKQAISDGKLNPNAHVPVEGGTMPVTSFVHQYNSQVEEAVEVTDSFKEEIEPLLIEELMERGVGVNRQQNILLLLAMDGIAKGAALFTLAQQSKEILNSLTGGAVTSGHSAPPPASNAEPSKQSRTQSAAEDNDDIEFHEPEEAAQETYEEVEQVEEEVDVPKPKAKSMGVPPSFGDADILAEAQKIAEQESGTSGRSKRKSKKP